MSRITIGIPKALPYYYLNDFWESFFSNLDVDLVYSCDTNNEIIERGERYANDEMCLSLKVYLGHIDYLKDKCDYLLIPRIEDYGNRNQMCTNFLALYDLVNNLFDVHILNYNISSKEDELKSLIKMGEEIDISEEDIKKAYKKSIKLKTDSKKSDQDNLLIVAHPYVVYDESIGKPIINMLNKYPYNIIYSDCFDAEKCNINGSILSPNLYWKYPKENIGSILMTPNLKGIIFLSSFPCALDSLVNEYIIRRVDKPYLNIIIDNIDSLTGIETRIESFMDIVTQN